MNKNIKMLVALMVLMTMTAPVLGEISVAEGTGYASGIGSYVIVSGTSISGDASAGALSYATGNDVFAQVNAYAGPGDDEDSTIAEVGTSAEGILSYSGAGASVDSDIGYVSVNFDAFAVGIPAETSAGATAQVQDDEISAAGGVEGSGLLALTLYGNNVNAESDEEGVDLAAEMTNVAYTAPGGYTSAYTVGTGGEGWLNLDGGAFAEGLGAGIVGYGEAQIVED